MSRRVKGHANAVNTSASPRTRPPGARSRRGSIAVVVVAAVTLAIAVAAVPTSSADSYRGHGHGVCGPRTFHTPEDAHVRVLVTRRHTSCRTALRIQREYFTAPARRRIVIAGGTGPDGYVLLERYPGWRCTSGVAVGACRKGRRLAGYEAFPSVVELAEAAG